MVIFIDVNVFNNMFCIKTFIIFYATITNLCHIFISVEIFEIDFFLLILFIWVRDFK